MDTNVTENIDIFEIRFVEEIAQMGLVGQRYSKYLKDFVDAAFQFHIVLHYRHKAISDQTTLRIFSG